MQKYISSVLLKVDQLHAKLPTPLWTTDRIVQYDRPVAYYRCSIRKFCQKNSGYDNEVPYSVCALEELDLRFYRKPILKIANLLYICHVPSLQPDRDVTRKAFWDDPPFCLCTRLVAKLLRQSRLLFLSWLSFGQLTIIFAAVCVIGCNINICNIQISLSKSYKTRQLIVDFACGSPEGVVISLKFIYNYHRRDEASGGLSKQNGGRYPIAHRIVRY